MSRRPWISGDELLLAVLIAIHLIPIWLLSYFPSQDGPAHLAIANILREYSRPEGAVLREYYELNRGVFPNLFVYFALGDLLRFLPVPVAEKVFLSAYVTLLPLSVRYAVRSVEPRNAFLAVLAVPFTFNLLLGMGFYNYCFSLPAFFFALGTWLRRREDLSLVRTLGFAALALWVYFCHVVSLGMLVAAVGALAARESLAEVRARGLRSSRWALLRPLAISLLALAPALGLAISFLGGTPLKSSSAPFLTKLRDLLRLASLVSFDERIQFFSLALAVVFGALAAWLLVRRQRGERRVRETGLLWVVAAFLALALVMPSSVGVGGFIPQRLSLFPFLALILWFAAFEHSARRRRTIQLLAAGLALGMLAMLSVRWVKLNSYLAEYVSIADHIDPGTTLLHLSYAHNGRAPDGSTLSFRIGSFMHAASHVTARKPVVDLRLYAAKFPGIFPIQYRPALNPYDHIALERRAERIPPKVSFLTYRRRTGGRVDYVVLWQLREDLRNTFAVKSVLRQLRLRYDRIYVSPRGLAQLYRRRGLAKERTTGTNAAPTVR